MVQHSFLRAGTVPSSNGFINLPMVLQRAGHIAWLFGIALAMLFFFGELCSMTSMGVPVFYPFAPARMHNPDLLTRYPLWQQRVRNYLSNPAQILRARGRARAWEKEKPDDE